MNRLLAALRRLLAPAGSRGYFTEALYRARPFPCTRTAPTPTTLRDQPSTRAGQLAAALADLHHPTARRGTDGIHLVCVECGCPWPCRTRTLAIRYGPTLADCPHCDPDHQPPWSQGWGVYVAPARDGDGQPVLLHVARPNGAHVAERDATWVRDVLQAAAADHHRAFPELPADEATDIVRADAARSAHHLAAIDLHQALGLPYDPTAEHQGHEDLETWWAHLVHQARTRTASELPAGAELAAAGPTVPWGSELHARTFNALTHALADRRRFVPLGDREHITRQILSELADDLLDEDKVPGPGEVSFQAGKATFQKCHQCGADEGRFRLTTYRTDTDPFVPVGRVDVCTECGSSPYQNTRTP